MHSHNPKLEEVLIPPLPLPPTPSLLVFILVTLFLSFAGLSASPPVTVDHIQEY